MTSGTIEERPLRPAERRRLVRKLMEMATLDAASFAIARAYGATVVANGDLLWRGEIDKAEFVARQDAALGEAVARLGA